jgi:hypothetical protein
MDSVSVMYAVRILVSLWEKSSNFASVPAAARWQLVPARFAVPR